MTAQVCSCPVQYLTGDCLVLGHFCSLCHMDDKALAPLAGPEQRQGQARTPALLAFPWHCYRACPAHCQLPTQGQSMQQPLPDLGPLDHLPQCISLKELISANALLAALYCSGHTAMSHRTNTKAVSKTSLRGFPSFYLLK